MIMAFIVSFHTTTQTLMIRREQYHLVEGRLEAVKSPIGSRRNVQHPGMNALPGPVTGSLAGR